MLLRCNEKPWNKRNKATGLYDLLLLHLVALFLVGD